MQRAEGRLVRRPTKTVSSDAVLPLPQVCIEALRSHRALKNRRRIEAGPAWHHSGLVFTTRYGLPLDPRNFHGMFTERAVAAGVPVVPVHSTRHECASLLVELQVHPCAGSALSCPIEVHQGQPG
jgi:integrase